ncbi:hypothetical protein LG634_16145 [Streptomyces bambusae]|uniref:hypothetical protein n=1 Tax=Streptomyces bambusae TaxID=1550616 RepID=UPI001CFDF8CD|nr:hypothetical protein [Streptomyces bambusae]MCB5166362.1 hypothetical protein [Streptomyces bambusae]
MRWLGKGAGAAPKGRRRLVAGLLLVAGAAVYAGSSAGPAGRTPDGPGCRSVAYMSVVGIAPECR